LSPARKVRKASTVARQINQLRTTLCTVLAAPVSATVGTLVGDWSLAVLPPEKHRALKGLSKSPDLNDFLPVWHHRMGSENHCKRLKDRRSAKTLKMVATDGIKPPTPAFSGPPTEQAKWFENQRMSLRQSTR
jgi:hypothetical protein